MPLSALIVDYDKERRDFISSAVSWAFPDSRIEFYNATEANGKRPQDFKEASDLAQRKFDLTVYNTKSNPSPKLYIESFKKSFPESHVFLYRDLPTVSVDDFDEYRLADGMATITKKDMADARKSKQLGDAIKEAIGKAIQASVNDSPAVKFAWVKGYTEALNTVTPAVEATGKFTKAMVGLGSALGGLVVGIAGAIAYFRG
jgi:hypothetical protein